jgi:hypothetical protein
VLAVLALLTSACSAGERLGRDLPLCGEDYVGRSTVMQTLAVPTAMFGPCIDDLPLGWDYQHQEAESGRARFWIDSDRLGDDFLTVVLTEACDTTRAFHTADPRPGIEALSEGPLTVEPVSITVIPRTQAAVGYATEVAVDIAGRELKGRPINVELDGRDIPAETRVADARATGGHALVVGMTEELRRTVELVRAEESEIEPLEEALEDIEDDVSAPRYRASWFFLFEGGCIEWAFDAHGEDVATLVEDVAQALDFYDLATMRDWATRNGFLIE